MLWQSEVKFASVFVLFVEGAEKTSSSVCFFLSALGLGWVKVIVYFGGARFESIARILSADPSFLMGPLIIILLKSSQIKSKTLDQP